MQMATEPQNSWGWKGKIKPELLETCNRKGSFQNGMAYIKRPSSFWLFLSVHWNVM